MSSFIQVLNSTSRRCATRTFRLKLTQFDQNVTSVVFARFKSRSARSTPSKPAKPTSKPAGLDNSTLRRRGRGAKVDSAKKASLLLNSFRKSMAPTEPAPVVENDKVEPASKGISARPVASSPRDFIKGMSQSTDHSPEDSVTLTIDEKEEAILHRIMVRRRKLLWPGIWTLLALTGTYGTLAYFDVKAGVPSSDGSQLSERVQLPQTWYLTPTVIREGIQAGWRDLDNLTMAIIAATFAIHLLKRSPLPIWEKLIHVTGEAKWTAFTYPLVNSSWAHAAQNMAALSWFLPGVVHYFDGDLFHTSAFLVSIPLVTSYLTHFAYRLNLASGLVLNLGASGSVAAAFGVYSVAYANEKIWVPQGIVLRLDAMYWGLLFAASQAYSMVKSPKGGNRPAYLVRFTGLRRSRLN